MSRRAFRGLLLAAWAFAPAALPAPKQDLDEVRGRLEVLKGELRESEVQRAEAADQLRAAEKAIAAANRRLRELTLQREAAERGLRDLEAQTLSTQQAIGRQQDEIARILHDQYVHGRSEPLRVVLSHEDPNVTARRLQYLTYVSRARAEVVAGLRRNLASIAVLAQEAQAKKSEIAAIESARQVERTALEREMQTRKRVLASVSAELAKQRRQYATLKRDEEHLTRLVEKLARSLARPKSRPKPRDRVVTNTGVPEDFAAGGNFRALKGRLRLPIAGELVSRFGSPQGDDGFSRKGIFIRGQPGQEVKAVAAGRVVFANWLRGFGNLVIVDHGDGFMSLYGNNDSNLKRPGDEVRAGEVLAAVGSSGGQEAPGLYFELRHKGRPLDPLPWAPPR